MQFVRKISSANCFVFLFFFTLSLEWMWFVRRYSTNILFSDQWDLYDAIFYEKGLVALFLKQHGPHRQGVGGVFSGIIMELTQWDTVFQSYSIALLLVLACFFFLVLKVKAFGKLTVFDSIVSLICLSLQQFETITLTPNSAHSVFPFLMLALLLMTLCYERTIFNGALVGVLGVLLTFTGFGIFVGPVLGCYLVYEVVWSARCGESSRVRSALLALCLLCVGVGVFFTDWVFTPAVDNFHVDFSIWSYAHYVIRMAGACFWGTWLQPLGDVLGGGV